MKEREFAGIDVSKATIDVWLYNVKSHRKFDNNEKGFKKMLIWVDKLTQSRYINTAFCYEHTGLYSLPLSLYLSEKQLCFYVVSGLLVKRSMGLKRGKSDKIDAQDLARFANVHCDELKPYQMPSQILIKLKELHSFRARLVKQCSGYKAHLGEIKQVLKTNENDFIVNASRDIIKIFNQKIRDVEKQMIQLIKADEKLSDTYGKITTIKGVGMILGIAMLVSTNNFKSFDNSRKFACYAGIAPFEHQSGTSYRGKSRISHLGNRKLKTLLSQAAASAIQHNTEMKIYYQKRISEGKNRMSTLNIIRNKLVSRIFAVAKRQEPYVDTCKYAA